jgi:hypothetical protein
MGQRLRPGWLKRIPIEIPLAGPRSFVVMVAAILALGGCIIWLLVKLFAGYADRLEGLS